jgi:predicted Ser/Thr protein kinase
MTLSPENASENIEVQVMPRKSGIFDTLQNITVGNLIGVGSYSQVFRGDWQGTPVALKRLKTQEHFAEFQREGNFLM